MENEKIVHLDLVCEKKVGEKDGKSFAYYVLYVPTSIPKMAVPVIIKEKALKPLLEMVIREADSSFFE